jgi:hypothetical protein
MLLGDECLRLWKVSKMNKWKIIALISFILIIAIAVALIVKSHFLLYDLGGN